MIRPWLAAMTCILALGCATSDRDRGWVERALQDRGVPTSGGEDALALIDDGMLDQDEAVAIALWQSPRFRADLARIDSARADLDEAGRPANPQLTLQGALGPTSAVAALLAPLESLWQIPARTEAASRALESIAESLVQTGLDLARDARLAHIERGLAEQRLMIRIELGTTWIELARIAEARARLGDTNPAEAAVVSAEASVAADAIHNEAMLLELLRARLRNVLGLDERIARFAISFTREPIEPPPLGALLGMARTSRPDLRAAELAVRAAAARAGWERTRVLLLAAQVDAFLGPGNDMSLRAGGRIELPIFGANPGGIGRAEAEIVRATAALEGARQLVLLELVQARARAVQAQASLATYRADVLPSLDEALRVATLSYELGEETYLVVIDVLRRIGEARVREAELVAEARRADAELERAAGARIGSRE